MELNVIRDRKLVEIWLTREDQQDAALNETLQTIFRSCHEKGCRPVVFCSGQQDLYENTRALLLYNRKRTAELQSKPSVAM